MTALPGFAYDQFAYLGSSGAWKHQRMKIAIALVAASAERAGSEQAPMV